MGDRCFVSFLVKSTDADNFRKIAEKYCVHTEEDSLGEGVVDFLCYDANYGYYTEIEAMVDDPECPPFLCDQGPGGDYGPIAHIFYRGRYDVVSTDHNGRPNLIPDLNHGIDYDDIAYVYLFLELEKEFWGYCKE